MSSPKLSPAHKSLIRRYLTWAYKSTKESFDRLERKTTQLLADDFILKKLSAAKAPRGQGAEEYLALINEFKGYVQAKKDQPISAGKYAYLAARLGAVEAAIEFYLGRNVLNSIKADYENEFTRRIWEAKDH